MKKYIAFLFVLSVAVCLFGCGKGEVKTDYSTTFTTQATESSEGELTTAPGPAPMDSKKTELKVIYGKNTGTKETYTGLEPLPQAEFPIVDPQNARGISEREINHSFGVSKNGVPHESSVNNQMLFVHK